MNHRILTPAERKRIRAYLDNGRGNGTKDVRIRQLHLLTRKYLMTIQEDVELLQQVLETYEREKAKKAKKAKG
jgi:hypothetical protein